MYYKIIRRFTAVYCSVTADMPIATKPGLHWKSERCSSIQLSIRVQSISYWGRV